jgi:iron(III) transport system permease protein
MSVAILHVFVNPATLFDLRQNGQVTELAAMGVLWMCYMLTVSTVFHVVTWRYQLPA